MKWRLFSIILLCLCSSLCAKPLQFSEFMDKTKKSLCPELTGHLSFKGDPGYNKGRLVANYYTSKDKFPKVIVYCKTTEDVQNAVRWARCHNMPMRIRSGGHNHEAFSTGTGAVLIDVSEMKKIKIDKAKRTATIQPGNNNLELYTQLFKEGFTHVGGTCADVGISGLVLSGGIGPLIRRVGLTCDTLVSFEMVDANGNILQVTKDNEHKDLFWATCGGGGGNFGIITSLVINIYPALPVTWFNIGWDWEQPVEEIITTWQKFFDKEDPKWFSHLDLWAKSFPKEKTKKMPIKVLGMFWGTQEEARKLLAAFLKIGKPQVQIENATWEQAIKYIEESTAVYLTSKPEYRTTGAYANDVLPDEATKLIVKTLEETTSPLFNVLLFSMGGASNKVFTDDTAYFYRDAKFFVMYSIQWLKKNEDKAQTKEMQTLRQKLLKYTVGDYIGNPDPTIKNYLTAYYGTNARKLRCVKRKYDPENIFKFEQSIPPAPLTWKCN